jgi:hypothetical protein
MPATAIHRIRLCQNHSSPGDDDEHPRGGTEDAQFLAGGARDLQHPREEQGIQERDQSRDGSGDTLEGWPSNSRSRAGWRGQGHGSPVRSDVRGGSVPGDAVGLRNVAAKRHPSMDA